MPKKLRNVHDLLEDLGFSKRIVSQVDKRIKNTSASRFLIICSTLVNKRLTSNLNADNSEIKMSDFIDCLDKLGYTVKVIATPKSGDGKDRVEGDL